MLKKIEGRYFWNRQMEENLREAERMIERYGWQERTIAPFGHSEPLMRYIGYMRDFPNCTEGSREWMVLFINNGFADILNAWERQEKEPKVLVRIIKTGKQIEIRETDLDMFEGLIERV